MESLASCSPSDGDACDNNGQDAQRIAKRLASFDSDEDVGADNPAKHNKTDSTDELYYSPITFDHNYSVESEPMICDIDHDEDSSTGLDDSSLSADELSLSSELTEAESPMGDLHQVQDDQLLHGTKVHWLDDTTIW